MAPVFNFLTVAQKMYRQLNSSPKLIFVHHVMERAQICLRKTSKLYDDISFILFFLVLLSDPSHQINFFEQLLALEIYTASSFG